MGTRRPAADEDEQIRAVQAGDEAAARALFERYAPTLRTQVRRRMPPGVRRKVADSDVLQEAYVAAFLSLGSFERQGDDAFRAWLGRILEHKILDEVRRWFGTSMRDARRDQTLAGEDAVPEVSASDPSPSMQAMAAEERAALWRAVADLPDDYATIVRLVHQAGLTLTEAGARMGRSGDAARKLYGRAVARLADGLLGGGEAGG